MAPKFERVLEAFRRAHPGARLRAVFTQNNLATNQKFFTAVAAGTPPDVTFVDGPQVASWAEQGALVPLTDRLGAAGVRAEMYFTPTWKQNLYQDEVWALTYCADPNFGFAYNREAFRQRGLDPSRPPRNIEELTTMADRLTESDNGVLRRFGMIPWAQYGPANSIFTWGWVFGGEFYDDVRRKITADDPAIVRALEWIASFARRYDPARVQSMQQGFGSAEQDPFYSGRLAMKCLHIGGINDIERYAPKLDYGITFIPAPPDGEQHSAWVGGWCMSIPRGARNPDLAWQFIHWLCATEEGSEVVGKETGLFPGLRASPYFTEVARRPYYGDYVRILEESRHQRPVMPVQSFYMRELGRAVEAAVYGRATAQVALSRARENTQAELDMVLAG